MSGLLVCMHIIQEQREREKEVCNEREREKEEDSSKLDRPIQGLPVLPDEVLPSSSSMPAPCAACPPVPAASVAWVCWFRDRAASSSLKAPVNVCWVDVGLEVVDVVEALSLSLVVGWVVEEEEVASVAVVAVVEGRGSCLLCIVCVGGERERVIDGRCVCMYM